VAEPARRRKLFEHPWRIAIIAVALLAVLNLSLILLDDTDTSTPGASSLPTFVESIHPNSGELTGLVDDVTIDLNDTLTGDMALNGRVIPEDQLDRTPELGIISFRPGKGKDFERLPSGENSVVVYAWPRTAARPEPLDKAPLRYSWTFRAAA